METTRYGAFELKIVGHNLVEYLLCDGHRRCLVLDDHARTQVAVVEHAVSPQRFASHVQLNLIGHERSGIAKVGNEMMDEMLTHPFLWSQRYIAATQRVVNLRMLTVATQLYFKRW